MTQKISDLTATDRLRGGTVFELQDPTNGSGQVTVENLLLGTQVDSTSQLMDDSSDVAEVEANTRALRVTPRPRDVVVPGYQVSRHSMGAQCSQQVTTTAPTDVPLIVGAWSSIGAGSMSGFALLNKVNVSMVQTALSGARSGTNVSRITLRPLSILVAISATSAWTLPPIGAAPSVAPANNEHYSSLKTRQLRPTMAIATVGLNAAVASFTAIESSRSLGDVIGSSVGVAGTLLIPPTTIFDAWGSGSYQPYVMSINTGFTVNFWAGAFGTSQTLDFSVTLEWDEYVPGSDDLI